MTANAPARYANRCSRCQFAPRRFCQPLVDVIASGASIGAFNAVAVLCRYPDVFGAAIGMSGSYRIERFYDEAWSEDLYYSAPMQFLPGLDGAHLGRLRQRQRT